MIGGQPHGLDLLDAIIPAIIHGLHGVAGRYMSPHGVFCGEYHLGVGAVRTLELLLEIHQCSLTFLLMGQEIFFIIIVSSTFIAPFPDLQRISPVGLKLLHSWIGFPSEHSKPGFVLTGFIIHQIVFTPFAMFSMVFIPDACIEYFRTL